MCFSVHSAIIAQKCYFHNIHLYEFQIPSVNGGNSGDRLVSPAQHTLFSFLKDRLLKILRFLHIFFKADSLRQLSLSSVFGKCIRPPTQQNQPN